MPLLMAIVTGHLTRTGRGGLFFKSCAVFFHVEFFFRKRHAILIHLGNEAGRLICRSRVSWVPSTVCLIVKCMIEAQRYPMMPKVYVICLAFVPQTSEKHY